VSANGHALERTDGTPFFFLSDTEWILNKRSDTQIQQILDDRKNRGFSVIQVFATRNWNRGTDPACTDANGNLPFVSNDVTRFNAAYWDRWRWVIDQAALRGLEFLLIFGEPGRLEAPWNCTTPSACYTYGRLVGAYFRDKPNVIFCNGQDLDANSGIGVAGWRAMAEGVADGVNGQNSYDGVADYSTTLMTWHGYGGYENFHTDAWLDFYGPEVWQNNTAVYGTINTGYNLAGPTKPVALLEGSYEGGTLVSGAPITPYYDRVEAYHTYFAGGMGYAYGNASNFQPAAGVSYLGSTGAQQMGVLSSFFRARPFSQLTPDQGILASGEGTGSARKVALRANDGSQCYVYYPTNSAASVRLDRVTTSSTVGATWFDPRSGATVSGGTFSRTQVPTLTPPSGWEDALLMLRAI
jgi:hypothetical protein